MATGNSMEIRKQYAPRPFMQEKCWTDEDFEPWLYGDYDICDQHPEVQIMLDLASQLADARAIWALKKFRDQQLAHGSPQTEDCRDPRFVLNSGAHRRGFDVRHE